MDNQPLAENDADSKLLEFPDDDIEVTTIQRQHRTVNPHIPNDPGYVSLCFQAVVYGFMYVQLVSKGLPDEEMKSELRTSKIVCQIHSTCRNVHTTNAVKVLFDEIIKILQHLLTCAYI